MTLNTEALAAYSILICLVTAILLWISLFITGNNLVRKPLLKKFEGKTHLYDLPGPFWFQTMCILSSIVIEPMRKRYFPFCPNLEDYLTASQIKYAYFHISVSCIFIVTLITGLLFMPEEAR